MRILLVSLLVVSSLFAGNRRQDYIARHPELRRSIIDAVQNGELVKGMPEEAVYAVMGFPPDKGILEDYKGYDIIVFGYPKMYLFLVQEGNELILIDWKKK